MTHIYDKNLQHIISLNYGLETFMTNPSLYYPDWEKECYASSIKFKNPILDDGQVREMTREELILLKNKTELLQDGEIIEDGAIKKIEVPSNLIRASWDRENQVWIETMTKEELMHTRKEKILKYAELKKEIATLEEFADEFESDNTVEMLKKEMQELKNEINDLYEKIKNLQEV